MSIEEARPGSPERFRQLLAELKDWNKAVRAFKIERAREISR